jgi:DNA polymerase-3 subunit alpha
MSEFTHLHVHTQFSILDGAAKIKTLVKHAKDIGMDSLAITDHGNMYGVLHFVKAAKEANIKPIIGCETYVASGSRFDKNNRGFHLILLAKNLVGYHNLSILSTLGFKEGYYYNARIDKELLRKYHEGLIASSACLGGEIPKAIMQHGMQKAEEVLQEYLDIFGDDFYLELMRHGIAEQETVNKALLELAAKYNVKVIATNDVHFVKADNYEAHQILICLNTDTKLDEVDGLAYTGNEYLKSASDMTELFKDIPEAILNTREIVNKIEEYSLEHPILLPTFPLPDGFTDENEYLRHLTYKGAKTRYPDLTDDITDRLDFELSVIRKMGFPGYFLVVQDFINAARQMGVTVGPGRGSAAGSAVAFCTGITNIDPIKYKLLFERFLNPERVSMPDIDVDFDDEGRERVLNYVIEKYGEDHVAQIVTFGTMAAKSAIRDVARVLKLPLPEADKLAKLVPEKAGTSLEDAFKEVPELQEARTKGHELVRKTLTFAEILEGSSRHTGTHACGVIIGPDDLKKHIPLAIQKDSKLMVTQYDGKLVESVGMLKMDFLGLKTLTIIREALSNVKKKNGQNINIDDIPLDDMPTYELYQKGETIGTFQFESEGMRQYLRELKPTTLEDLFAMNALYRPGPMQYIPLYINRKHGREPVEYPHEMLQEILESTQGIMVYQEQIMQAAQIMGGFTLGRADILRRAMGKKNKEEMEKQKADFIEGALLKGVTKVNATEVFETMEKFADYGFNRSHSAAYSVVAYQTGYLKANYPAEYMAAVLTHNLGEIKKLTFFIDECQRLGIAVLGPDINESDLNFFVNKKGEIRFGMAAIKGVGENAVKHIIEEREANGPYASLMDFLTRVNLRTVNRKCLEALACAGALDCFENTHRAQYFYQERPEDSTFLERIIKHANIFQDKKNNSQVSLFGDVEEYRLPDIEMPACPIWSNIERLRREKEVTGFYISGHPLNEYKTEIDNFVTIAIGEFKDDLKPFKDKEFYFAGMISNAKHKTTANNKPFGSFTIEDLNDSTNLAVFSEDYLKNKHLMVDERSLLIKARVSPRYNSADTLELKITGMWLLSEVLEKFTNEIFLMVILTEVNENLIGKLEALINAHPGPCRVKFQIFDIADKLSINLNPKKTSVNAPEFLRAVRKFENVKFKITKKVF